MPNMPSLTDLLKAGVHFGHSAGRWHPKMKPFIFGERSGVHILNLEKTQEMLDRTLTHVKQISGRGGIILFVGTKRQAQSIVKKYAEACGMPYVIDRWLGGTLTNFPQIKQSIKRFKMLKDQRDKGELRKYTKKEQLMISWEIEDMEKRLGGIENMTKIPDAMFVVDIRTERTAVREATSVGTQVIAICDTNVNPTGVDDIIPSNDDAVKAIELITKLVSDAVKEGKAQAVTTAAKEANKPPAQPAAEV
ncbi:30S ribosomal protein S2 [Candidatus Uhrbacteria bacterium]|nr:30S ribosomal protein S2 [Candidatus Uhrbacteria bacterium]